MKPKNRKPGKGQPSAKGFVTKYVNRRTGKLMVAADFGYKAWPFGPKKRKG
jgi:hypothetical protein